MEILSAHLSWIIAGVLALVVLILLMRPRKAPAPAPRIERAEIDLANLRSQHRELESRYHAQLEFFINFPEVVRTLTAALSLEQVLSACSRGLGALLQTRSIGIWLAMDRTHLCLVDGAGFPDAYRGELVSSLSDLSIAPLLEYRGVSNVRAYPAVAAYLQRHDLPWELAAPIWYGDSLFGVMMVGQTAGEAAMVHRILVMMTDLTAVGLHAAGRVSQIKEEAELDGLTGLANRRTLQRHVEHELQRAQAYGSNLTLAMIDVDHFKSYNDQNGHGAGDEVLRTIARLFSGTSRRTDLVARYGGEEFTILICGADREMAAHHADRVRRAVEAHDFPHGERQPLGRLSVSIGLASYPTDAADVGTLFEAADRALYLAKEAGRNRVEVYSGPPLSVGSDAA